jgi:hypothetical protein
MMHGVLGPVNDGATGQGALGRARPQLLILAPVCCPHEESEREEGVMERTDGHRELTRGAGKGGRGQAAGMDVQALGTPLFVPKYASGCSGCT